jgi:TolB-like protein/class 3 adenylate cyclase
VERRLAAILAADVVGYSRLMGIDEVGTLRDLTQRRGILDGLIVLHRGRIANTAGDSVLVEFGSAVDAVRCAVEAQAALARANAELSAERQVNFRIGVHVGDVMVKGGDLFGDGVNIAARLEGIAEPGGICISDDAQRQVRGKVDIAFDDMGPRSLKNITEPMRAWRVRLSGDAFALAKAAAESARPLALPDKPSIAVLPFQNMSGDPEQEYFADGMVEDIITALSRFKSLFVIARSSSFTYKGNAVDIKQVGRELGVRYVLEGSVRKAGGRVRITGQLIEATTGAHLWADRFDGALEDIFELQDKVTTSVVGSIAPALDQAEIERAKRKPVENLDAYDCYLRGLALSYGSTRDALDEALLLAYRAIELDQAFAAAYGLAADCYKECKIQGWVVNPATDEAEARRLALAAATLGPDDARALCCAGFALFYVCRDEEAGKALIDRALTLNQNLARGWNMRAAVSLFLGRHEEVIEYAMRALRLSPIDPGVYRSESNVAAAFLLSGRYDEAISWSAKALTRQPNYMLALRTLAAANALKGNLDEAQRTMTRLREVYPALRLSNYTDYLPYRQHEDIERMLEGLRLAGLPE